MSYCECFKSPTAKLPMTAKQAAALADISYQKLYDEYMQTNLTRWKDEAIKAIDEAASYGNYQTFIWIYKGTWGDEFQIIGLEDFCDWLQTFGYKVTTDDDRIYIKWKQG